MTDLADICGRPTCTLLRDEHAPDGTCPAQGDTRVLFLPHDHNGVTAVVARFVLRHPSCCPHCGWHLSSHGNSHGPYSDCPWGGRPPAVEDRTVVDLSRYLTRPQLSAMARKRADVYEAAQAAIRAHLGAEAGVVDADVLEAYREAYPTDHGVADARAFAAFTAGFDAARRLR